VNINIYLDPISCKLSMKQKPSI